MQALANTGAWLSRARDQLSRLQWTTIVPSFAGPGAEECIVEVAVGMLTPELAGQLIQSQGSNRRVRPMQVRKLKAVLSEERWRFNGEPIILFADGTMGNGQHTCLAVIETQISVPKLFVRGVARDSWETMDQASIRLAADTLAARGIPNAVNVAATLRCLCLYERCGFFGQKSAPVHANMAISKFVVESALADYPEIQDGVRLGSRIDSKGDIKCLPKSVLCAFMTLAFRSDAEKAEGFTEQMAGGWGEPNSPCVRLRAALKERHARSPRDAEACLIRAWNAYKEGRQVTLLKGLIKDREGNELGPPKVE